MSKVQTGEYFCFIIGYPKFNSNAQKCVRSIRIVLHNARLQRTILHPYIYQPEWR